jgi:hypothetical protein
MLIHCTQKLLDAAKIQPSIVTDDFDPMFSWRANIKTVNRRKTLVLMCDLNRYVVVLYGIKAKDFKELGKRIIEAIRNTLHRDQVNPDVIERYLAEAGEPVYVKNTDRSQTARLNKACDDVYIILEDMDDGYSDTIGVLASHRIVSNTEKEFYYPFERMIDNLSRFGIQPVLKCRAFELTVRLALGKRDAVRKIIVPADITFIQLHRVLQAAFGWGDYHLFDFLLFEDEGQEEACAGLVIGEEDLECHGGNARLMDDVMLSDYLPRCKYLLYRYDLGDNWHHFIEVTGVFDAFAERLPLLIAGEGNAPPEDVGGEGGYEEFMKIMANPSHEDYEYVYDWAKGQGYREFDFERASRLVRYSLWW